uniref:Uncharacterized protein n=1 Tax=Anguilla anguilla TaxID=7936 RepID=A0A0E9WXB2_ANGAN
MAVSIGTLFYEHLTFHKGSRNPCICGRALCAMLTAMAAAYFRKLEQASLVQTWVGVWKQTFFSASTEMSSLGCGSLRSGNNCFCDFKIRNK